MLNGPSNHTICPHVRIQVGHTRPDHHSRGFLGIILAGALLLMLPVSSRMAVTPFSDALLTATSATCVTGLVVHDTATYWSPFGHLVLLADPDWRHGEDCGLIRLPASPAGNRPATALGDAGSDLRPTGGRDRAHD